MKKIMIIAIVVDLIIMSLVIDNDREIREHINRTDSAIINVR